MAEELLLRKFGIALFLPLRIIGSARFRVGIVSEYLDGPLLRPSPKENVVPLTNDNITQFCLLYSVLWTVVKGVALSPCQLLFQVHISTNI